MRALLFAALAFLGTTAARADDLVLKDGTALTGKVVVRAEDGTITFQAANGALRRVAPADIRDLRETDAARAGYVRYHEYLPGVARLEVLCRTLRSPDRAKTVVLAGAVHIGDFSYYRRLQRVLDDQDLVLYEGIGARPHGEDLARFEPTPPEERARERARPLRPGTHRRSDAADLDLLTRLQVLMGESLELTFQPDGVDYDRTWWVPADVTIADMRRHFSERETSLASDFLSGAAVRTQMRAQDIMGRALADVAASVVTGKKVKDVWKETFAKLLASEMSGGAFVADDAAAGPRTVTEEVLITRRNEAVLRKLDEALRAPRVRSIAIFYGAGHDPDFERRLRERGFTPVRDEWLAAWDIRSGP